ncbi:MAG: YmdB family metallophosphoesterase [Spirochaetia bacterium]|nr:YmdB family metallophosphoesterase [Spirochaetia bacterium]
MKTRILFLGEIVGKPGLHVIKKGLKALKEEHHIDFCVANGEGATNGFGIGHIHAIQLFKSGLDLITTGEKTYFKKDMVDSISTTSKIIRPANFPSSSPGKGYKIVEINGKKCAFITLLGTSEFSRISVSNPFIIINTLIDRLKEDTDAIFLQFHASTTAEKNTMAFHVDGRIAAMIGTHTKVLTSDARLLALNTAMITDNGMCGSISGVGGFEAKTEITRFITQVPSRSIETWGTLEAQGVIVELDDSAKAVSIETIKYHVESPEKQG